MNFDLLVEKYIKEAKADRPASNLPSDEILLKAWEAHPSLSYLSRYYNVNTQALRDKLTELGITDFKGTSSLTTLKKVKLPPLPAYEIKPVELGPRGAPRSDLGVTDEELIELYKKLRSTAAVAREISKPQPTVYRRIKLLGQKVEGPLGAKRRMLGGKTDEELLKMAKSLSQYDSINNMAKRLKIPTPTLYNRLKILGYISPLHKQRYTRIPPIPISDEDFVSLYNNAGGSVNEITKKLFPGEERKQYIIVNKIKELKKQGKIQ